MCGAIWSYLGLVKLNHAVDAYFKIVNGTLKKGDKVRFFHTGKEYLADEIGILKMDQVPQKKLSAGNRSTNSSIFIAFSFIIECDLLILKLIKALFK